MPTPRRLSPGEALIITTLLSIHLASRGTVLAIAAAQTGPSAWRRGVLTASRSLPAGPRTRAARRR